MMLFLFFVTYLVWQWTTVLQVINALVKAISCTAKAASDFATIVDREVSQFYALCADYMCNI